MGVQGSEGVKGEEEAGGKKTEGEKWDERWFLEYEGEDLMILDYVEMEGGAEAEVAGWVEEGQGGRDFSFQQTHQHSTRL